MEEKENHRTRNIIITIIIIIIIILLLLHSCCNGKKDDGTPDGAVINLCDGKECGSKVDCSKDSKNSLCIIPDFTGKTRKDVEEWLEKIENKIKIKYVYEYNEEQNGIIFDQSSKGKSLKDLINDNEELIIKISNNKDNKVDCLKDVNNRLCLVPDFTGKTKDDVEKWLESINNLIDVQYEVKDYNKKEGTIIDQSNKGKRIKDLLDENQNLSVTFANSRKEQVDCLKDIYNELCIIPDFTGKTKQDVLDWLDKVTNNLKSEFKEEKSNKKTGTVTNQSDKGKTVKDLIENNKELVITFANSDKVNCLVDDSNPICLIPNFTGATKKDVQNWLDSIDVPIKTKYENKSSSNTAGTIIKQSNKKGQTIKDLYTSKSTLVLTLVEEKTTPVDKPVEKPTEKPVEKPDENKEEEVEGKLIVKDSNATWSETTDAKIFESSTAKVEGTIAPESTGTYNFIVKNETNSQIKYNIIFTETNEHGINMKYKLKKNGTYVKEEYVSANELNLSDVLINSNTNDSYDLEWKWVSSDNDTEIGKTPNVLFDLKINVEAESAQ